MDGRKTEMSRCPKCGNEDDNGIEIPIEPETDWGTMVGEFSVAMLGRILQKEDDGWSGWQTITENEYRLRAIKNIINGDYVEAANLCLLADAVRGTQEANDEKV